VDKIILLFIFISSLLFFVCVFCGYKIYRVHLKLFSISDGVEYQCNNVYRQLESLQSIYRDIGLEGSLPPLRGWAGSPDYLLEVARQVLKRRPNVAVECGSGASSIVISSCMRKVGTGHLYSIDHDLEYSNKTKELIEAHGLSDWATVIYAPMVEYDINGEKWLWYSLDDLNIRGIDFLNVDGPPAALSSLARYPALPLLKEFMSDEFVVLMDDAYRSGETQIVKLWREMIPSVSVDSMELEKGFCILSCRH